MIGWFYDLLYGAYRVEFESDFDLPESVRRLSAATSRTIFLTWTHQAAVGKVSESRVSLQRVIPFFGNSMKPFFCGEFHVRDGRTILSGRFTLHWFTKAFLSVWFGFCLLFCLFTAATAFLHSDQDVVWLPLVPFGMLLWGIWLLWFGKWLSNDIAWLSERIEKALSDRPQGGDAPLSSDRAIPA